jgi:hypothetical protein
MLTISRRHDTLPDLRAALTGNGLHQVCMWNAGDLHVYIDAIKERTG